MKYDLTDQEEALAVKIYDELGGVSIARAKIVLTEVNRLIKELTAAMEEKTSIKEAGDLL